MHATHGRRIADFCGTWGASARRAVLRLQQAIDTELLAKAAAWVATEPRCAGEVFNVTNGGLFRWQHMWPRIADFFAIECGPIQTIRLTEVMADKGPLWNSMVDQYGLRKKRTW